VTSWDDLRFVLELARADNVTEAARVLGSPRPPSTVHRLRIGGGRHYGEATATPIVIEGTFTFDGEDYAVSGAFQRE